MSGVNTSPASADDDDSPTPDEPLGLRERKRRATEAALRRAAVDLASEQGFDAITIDEICRRAGVSPRTFFNYFPSKEDAVLQARPSPPTGDDLERFCAGGPSGDLVTDLATMMGAHLAARLPPATDLVRHHHLLHSDPRLEAHFRAGLRDLEVGIARAIATRTDTPVEDLPVQVLSAVASGVVRVAMTRWIAAGGDLPVQAVVDDTFDTLRLGLDADALFAPA